MYSKLYTSSGYCQISVLSESALSRGKKPVAPGVPSAAGGHLAEQWARQGSNLRPTGYEPAALPLSYEPVLPPVTGFIVMAARLTWSGRRDSNPRHPAWKAGTLPLSYSRKTKSILPQISCLVNKKRVPRRDVSLNGDG